MLLNGMTWAPIRAKDIVDDLLRRERQALTGGYRGLRTNGNCAWVERGQWADFQSYESLVQEVVRGRRMICMCSYCLGRHQSAEMLDVMARHDFMLPAPARGFSLRCPSPERAASDHFPGIVEAIPAAMYVTDAEGYLISYNKAAEGLWGYRPELGKQRWCGSWKFFLPDGTPVPLDQCPMATMLKTGRPAYGIEADIERPDGTRRHCAVYPTPLLDETGKLTGGINMLVDITERKAAEDRHLTLAREMRHRVNNTLAMVQAIMGSTMRYSTSMDEFRRSFTSRIDALSKTHALLTNKAELGASLRHLFKNELSMFEDGDGSRVMLFGPDFILPERLAVPVGMMIHELATNAVKYGALSSLDGALSVEWMRNDGHIEMHWRERNIPIMQKPERSGFGTRLLKDILPRQIGARIDMDYQSDGLTARLIIPV